ncbi:MAG: hypothetical protein ACOYXT_29080 [Bacteroidota bacterium]
MRIETAIIALVCFGQLGCSNESFDINSFKDDHSITTLNGTWKVISFENYADNRREFKNEENSRGLDITINFNDTKDPNELSGTNTTNTVLGEFEYTGTRKFKITNYGTTEIAQPVWADKFNHAILSGEVDFKINRIGLRIYYDNKTKSVTLIAK